MVDDKINDQPHVALLDARKKLVEVGHGAELGHDLPIVTNVVAAINVRRVKMGAKPDHVHSQLLQVIELGVNAGQVADAVAVRVFERARVDLVCLLYTSRCV